MGISYKLGECIANGKVDSIGMREENEFARGCMASESIAVPKE